MGKRFIKDLHIRITEEEYNKLIKNTEKFNFNTISDYVRNYLFSDKKNLIDPKAYLKGMNELTVSVNRVGNNINQIAKYINSTKSISNTPLIKEYNQLFSAYLNLLTEVNKQIENVYNIKTEKI